MLILVISLGLYLAPFLKFVEGFDSGDLKTPGTYPISVDQAILNDFPKIGKNQTSLNNYSDIWWHYPVFKVGSYKQITNNIRYPYNPDEGTCVRADFCNAVYYNKKNTKTNYVTPLPPAEEGPGARVGYFRSEPNELYFSIPTNENILY
jgi:hypothetical protein